ncbi:uncharacterized protein LOC123875308 [Maniola jurtina]|uniref:uncharacterized protein LOC123875308 n=1 Tax=Maniola jurtina TaxID=191418 RepID=UPI001E686F90|nr:uncharacterized protein LOC123875308 [Maniola jurtina]
MSKMIFLVIFVVSVGLSSAQLVQNLKCDPNINLVNNFNVTKFLGKWHVVRRTEKPGHPTECSHLEIVKENDQIHLHDRVVNQNFLEEVKSPATHPAGTAKLSINRVNSNEPTDFWILSTDYEHFTLAYACEDDGPARKVTIWQLGREPSFPTPAMDTLMNQTLSTLLDITTTNLIAVDHSETACRILPDIPAGQNVILPGQCDPNMPVVQNFNVPAFLGEWIGISSYYSANQLGACGRAKYTLSESAVVVENSMVVNQKLEVIRGRAVVNTPDGSARLLVTLEVRPGVFVDSPLWVLATDYTNYAVSYTCLNLPNNQKQVNAWILSRTRQLTNAAQLDVDRVISSEVDLNKRYFIEADQSEQSCFYYPEPVPQQPVVFRGRCDPNIPAMANFNAVAMIGDMLGREIKILVLEMESRILLPTIV